MAPNEMNAKRMRFFVLMKKMMRHSDLKMIGFLLVFFLSLSALLYICDLLVNLKKHEGEFLFKL